MAMEATDLMTTDLMTTYDVMSNWTSNDTSGDTNNNHIIKITTKMIHILILMFLMVSMGCTIDLKDFRETFRHPQGFFVGLLCQFVLMPLLAFVMAIAFNLEVAGAISILTLASCPGGTLSNVFTYWTDGDVCLSVCMTTINTAIAIGMMPLNLFIYSRRWTNEKAVIPYVNIVTTLISILVPVAFGVLLRWWKKEWMVYFTKVGIFFSFLCIAISWVMNFLLNPSFLYAAWQLWVCAALLPIVGYMMGYAMARLLRQPHYKCRTVAFETGSQNVSLALTITVLTFSETPIFFDMLFYPTLYSCFIYVDSFTVIAIYKCVVRYLDKKKEAEEEGLEGDEEDEKKYSRVESESDDEKKSEEISEADNDKDLDVTKVKLIESDQVVMATIAGENGV